MKSVHDVTLFALISHLLKTNFKIEKIALTKGAVYIKCKWLLLLRELCVEMDLQQET